MTSHTREFFSYCIYVSPLQFWGASVDCPLVSPCGGAVLLGPDYVGILI